MDLSFCLATLTLRSSLISREIPQHNTNNSAKAPYYPPFPLDGNVTVRIFLIYWQRVSVAAHAKLNIAAAKEQHGLGCLGLADSLFDIEYDENKLINHMIS